MRSINTFKVNELKNNSMHKYINGRWVSARPIGLTGLKYRIKCAYLVFVGKADIVQWEDQ